MRRAVTLLAALMPVLMPVLMAVLMAALIALPLSGCARPAGPVGDPTPGNPGVTPTAPLNPSLPPDGGPILTGLRAGNAALEIWFGHAGRQPLLDYGWYDPATGQPVSGPRPTLGWAPTDPGGRGFQDIEEAPAPDGAAIDLGWLIGPADAVQVDIAGTRLRAGTAGWSGDHRITVFWLRRPGPVRHYGDHAPDSQRPRFVALDAHGTAMFSQLLVERTTFPRQDG